MRTLSEWLVLLALLAAGALLWLGRPMPEPVAAWRPAKPDPILRGVPTQDITPPKIKVYAPIAKQKLKLPDPVQADPHTYVLTSSRLPNDTHPQTVTTVINDQTGDVSTITRREPLPWLAIEKTGELRLDYGIKRGLDRVARLSYREDFIQVKAFHAGLTAAIDSDGEYFVGVGVGWKW